MELYTNARFISCEKENRIYTAMAVKGGHIVWLGDESSIPPRYGKAKRVDLGGATVTPAFGDTHMHFGSLCVFENTFYLMDVKNFAEAKAAVRRYGDSHRKTRCSWATAAPRTPLPSIGCPKSAILTTGRNVRSWS